MKLYIMQMLSLIHLISFIAVVAIGSTLAVGGTDSALHPYRKYLVAGLILPLLVLVFMPSTAVLRGVL